MLKLSKNDGTPIAEFETHQELYQYISDLENGKLEEVHPESGKTGWSFRVIPPEKVPEIAKYLRKGYDLEVLTRALREKEGIIEMCLGDENNYSLIPASPWVDVEGFRNEFCDDYCHAHKLILTESGEHREAESEGKLVVRVFRFIRLLFKSHYTKNRITGMF